jgi:hypothetical protein
MLQESSANQLMGCRLEICTIEGETIGHIRVLRRRLETPEQAINRMFRDNMTGILEWANTQNIDWVKISAKTPSHSAELPTFDPRGLRRAIGRLKAAQARVAYHP